MYIQPRLLRPFPKLWIYPLDLWLPDPGPTLPGLTKMVLGNWNVHSSVWPVKMNISAEDRVLVPSLLVEERQPPQHYKFTFKLVHPDIYMN